MLTRTNRGLHFDLADSTLGLISGHYDVMRKVSRRTTEEDEDFESEADAMDVPLNSGIALVIPAQAILDLVFDEEQVLRQKQRMSEFICPLPEM